MISEIQARLEILSVDQHNVGITIQLEEMIETAPLVSMLVSSGAQVEEITKSQSSLEEVFLTLVNEDQDSTEDIDAN